MRLVRCGNTLSWWGRPNMVRSPILERTKNCISTWICNLRPGLKPVGVAACLALAGCGGGFDGSLRSTSSSSGGSFFGALTGNAGQREATVGGAAVKIAGPEGYCVDPQYERVSGDTTFLLLASCAAITGSSRAKAPADPAVLLASVGEPSSQPVTANLADLDTLLRSETGRGLLSRSNDPATVQVLESFAMDDTLFLRVRDTSPNDQPGLADDYWRAITDVKRSGVTLSVMGPAATPLGANQGLQVLRSYVAEVKARNGEGPAPVALAATTQPQQQDQQQQQTSAPQPAAAPIFNPLQGIGILRRLLS